MRIDTSKIEGYEDMTPEQKVAALEGADIPDPDYSGYVKKDQFDKVSSELAAKKKELKSYMTEEDRKKQENDDKFNTLQADYNDLRRRWNISENKAKYISLGYDEALAEDTATALVDGDTEKVFKNQSTFLESMKKKITADNLKKTPHPNGGGEPAPVDYTKMIEEADKAGDSLRATYYTRLQQMQNVNK